MAQARRIVIVGNGIAGITAARHIRKRSADDQILVISAETEHFFSRTALMYIYMGHMTYADTKPYADSFWDDNRIELVRGRVARVDPDRKRLFFDDDAELPYDVLILAPGSKSNLFDWPGQDSAGVQGLYSYPDLERMERYTAGIERGVVVGGGLIGIETAEMLHSREIPVTFLVREQRWMEKLFPREESELIHRQIRANGIDLRLGTELESILPDDDGRVRAVTTTDGEKIPCQFCALTVGVSPNVDWLRESGIEIDRGLLVDRQLRTSAPDVYAIGDAAQLREAAPGRRSIEAVWYAGRRMGQTVARTITGEPTDYDQGIWFNSAKFFDLEWQIYGDVPASAPDGVESLFWQDAENYRAIRINYRSDDRAVVGFQLMGIRYRHEACHRWIEESRPIEWVLRNLGAANFDPELFGQHEAELVAVYNRGNPPQPISLERKRGLRNWLGL